MSDFLSGLTVADAEVPAITRDRNVKDNPFVEWVSDSFDRKTGKSVTIEGVNATQVVSLIRSAAAALALGVRIVVQDSKKNSLDRDALKALKESNSKAKVTVLFLAKAKRQYNRKAETPSA